MSVPEASAGARLPVNLSHFAMAASLGWQARGRHGVPELARVGGGSNRPPMRLLGWVVLGGP